MGTVTWMVSTVVRGMAQSLAGYVEGFGRSQVRGRRVCWLTWWGEFARKGLLKARRKVGHRGSHVERQKEGATLRRVRCRYLFLFIL